MTEPGYSIVVTSADKLTVQESNETILSVQFDIRKDGEAVQTLRHGFPLEASEDEIMTALEAVLAAHISDSANAKRNAALEAANKVADETISALIGQEITS